MEPHAIALETLFTELKTSPAGLSSEEAKKRLEEHGPNSVAIKKQVSPLSIFISQFRNSLVLLLLAAALVSFALSWVNPEQADWMDSALIFAIVIANAAFGFFQEYKAERTIEALTRMSAPKASVMRDDVEVDVDSESVVPGDILLLSEGDKVAADARLIEAFSLYSDESMLTGESVPSHKAPGVLENNTALAERDNLVFMNTVITRGRAKALVVRTGLESEVGKIAKQIAEAPPKTTRFQREIEDVGKKVTLITVAILAVIAATEFLMRTGDVLFIFMAAVALGVAAIPEGLPAVVTLALSIATNRMLRENALMRRLATVQDLGSVDVICTDKTGTLTENVMTVTMIHLGADREAIEVSGKGLHLAGSFSRSPPGLDALLRCAMLCNDARMVEERGNMRLKGDPTEIAILVPAYKAGLDVEKERSARPRLGEVPFSSERKLMSIASKEGKSAYSYVKGAPEVLLGRCTSIYDGGKKRKFDAKDRERILAQNERMAGEALRVLGFAIKENPKSFDEDGMEQGLAYLGLMGMRDPPREGVREAIEDCRRAGIRTIMITGDNRHTAEAIAKELGFASNSLSGEELDSLDGRELAKAVGAIDVYARTSPRHKVMLLKALQMEGHSVCMTGDGVNDAAAIKSSDVGVSMGIRGTEVTKQASDMVVLDDNFISIRNAVMLGRGTFDNIRKFVAYLLGANIAEVGIVFLATVLSLGISSKIAVQLLWINLVTDGLPALALGVDPPAKDIMKRRPRPKDEPIMDARTLYFIASIGVSATIAILALYAYMLAEGSKILAQSALFTTFVIMEMLVVYIVRWKYNTAALSNPYLHAAVACSLILQLIVVYSPVNSFFGVVPLGVSEVEKIAASLLIFAFLLVLSMIFGRIFFPPVAFKNTLKEENTITRSPK